MAYKGILNKQLLRDIVITVIVLNIIFLGVFISFGYKSIKNEYCNIEDIETEGVGVQTLYTLNSADDVLRFENINSYNNQANALLHEYCVYSNTSSSNALQLQLLNVDDDVISESYLTNTDEKACFSVKDLPLDTIISCSSCDISNAVNINGYVTSTDEKYFFNNDGTITIEGNEQVIQELSSFLHCKEWFGDIIWAWLRLNGLILLILLIGVGLDYMGRLLNFGN